MIYFIRAMQSGAIKIGTSNDPKRRLETMQTGSPEPLELIGVLPGQADAEKVLHRTFAKFRIHGEWFKGDEELIREIKALVRLPIEELIDSVAADFWLIDGEAGNDSGGGTASLFCVCRDGRLYPDPDEMMAATSPHGHRFWKIDSIQNVDGSRHAWPEDLEVLREPLTNKSCLVWVADFAQSDRFFPLLPPESKNESSVSDSVFVVGARVAHAAYGFGEVTERSVEVSRSSGTTARKVRIRFADGGERTIGLPNMSLRLMPPVARTNGDTPKLIRMPVTLPEWARPSNS